MNLLKKIYLKHIHTIWASEIKSLEKLSKYSKLMIFQEVLYNITL